MSTARKPRNHHARVYDGERVDIKAYACADCDINTHDIGEYYVVSDKLWLSTLGLREYFKMLCVGCFERRIGRRLRPSDFKRVPPSLEPGELRSSRLQERLGIWKAPRRKRAKLRG